MASRHDTAEASDTADATDAAERRLCHGQPRGKPPPSPPRASYRSPPFEPIFTARQHRPFVQTGGNMATKEEILDGIAGMTVLELSELLKAFEEKFGVTAAAPVAVAAAAAAGGGGAEAAPVEEEDEFDVILLLLRARRRSRSSKRCAPSRAWGLRRPRTSWTALRSPSRRRCRRKTPRRQKPSSRRPAPGRAQVRPPSGPTRPGAGPMAPSDKCQIDILTSGHGSRTLHQATSACRLLARPAAYMNGCRAFRQVTAALLVP